MFIESPFLSSIDLSSNTSLFSICRSSFVRHEFLQTGIVRNDMESFIDLLPNIHRYYRSSYNKGVISFPVLVLGAGNEA